MDREDRLVKEYELCLAKAQGIEAPIWATSALVGFGSVAGFVPVLQSPLRGEHAITYWQGAGAGAFVVFLNCLWWKIATRWWGIMQTVFLRMSHIEDEVGPFLMQHYVEWRDSKRASGTPVPATLPSARMVQLSDVHHYQVHGPRWYSGIFVIGNYIAWSAYVILSFPKAAWRWVFLGVLPLYWLVLSLAEAIRLRWRRVENKPRAAFVLAGLVFFTAVSVGVLVLIWI